MNRNIFVASFFYILLIFISLSIDTFTDFNVMRLPSTQGIPLQIASGLMTAIIIISITCALSYRTSFFADLEKEFAKILLPVSIQTVFFLSIFSALGEELLFRGVLLQKSGLIFSSLLFGIIHFIPRKKFLPWTFFAITLGFILGLLFQWTGSLLAPILAHFLINFTNMILLRNRFAGKPL